MKEAINKLKDVGAVFEAFKIEEKMEELKDILVTEKIDLKNESMIIIVPSYDESKRLIKEEDRMLFDIQLKDAHALAQHLILDMDVDVVNIITDFAQLNGSLRGITPPYDHIIFLHEFIPFEKNYILDEVNKFALGRMVRSIELY